MTLSSQTGLDAGMREHFIYFLMKAFSELSPGDEFLRGWHLDAITWRLDGIRRDGAGRLIVNVPPRSLKSILISVAWVAWMLGKDPRLKFVCVSYSSDLALKHARDCRLLMQTDWYRRLFPKTAIRRHAENDLETTAGGGRFSTSIGGTLTGRGGDFIILDDPHKADEAASKPRRQEVIDWFKNNALTRLNNKTRGSIILVMQRLHENDLSGYLLAAGGWTHLCLPAEAIEDQKIQIGPTKFHHRRRGDLLQPDREPLSVLLRQQRDMGSVDYAGQYQQAPVPAGGLMIQKDWLQYFELLPERRASDLIVQSWDCANKDGAMHDFSACVTALIRGREVYVLDVFRHRLDFPALKRAVEERHDRFNPNHILIEDAGSGTPLIQTLNSEGRILRPKPIAARIDKQSRVSGISGRIENGEVRFAREAPWRADFERELLGFPSAEHDDQVDALAQLIMWDTTRQRREWLPVGPRLIEGLSPGAVDPLDLEDRLWDSVDGQPTRNPDGSPLASGHSRW